MSRIIVKNLPKKINSQQLSEDFSKHGCITDLQLKYTKEGVFRKFAFIGYKTEQEAKNAKSYFHNTYLQASKIQVEICADLGSEDKPIAWSKHTKSKESKKRNDEKTADDNQHKKKKKKKERDNNDDIPEELQNDEQFAEFLELSKDRKSKPVWVDEAVDLKKDDKESGDEDGDNTKDNDGVEHEDMDVKVESTEMTDLEYMQSKMKSSIVEIKKEPTENIPIKKKSEKVLDDSFTVTLRNLPFRCKKKQIKTFLSPLKIVSLRFPPKLKGFAYAKFKTEKEMNCALNKNKGFLNGHRVNVIKYERKNTVENANDNKNVEEDRSAEILAESGRLFIRNLCYDVKEEELETQFSKFGPLAEIHLPIDSYSKKGQGFAFISYIFAEHAVKAFLELDGKIFQGRVLHIIAGKPKKESVDINELSYKKKKDAKLKALSTSSYNWNTLFLGQNAVADAMAKKFNVTKSQLLNDEDNESLAVRMALCETQLVKETREFLIENRIQLDAFSQAAAERSKNVIIVKNLPANTPTSELHDVFSRHGTVSRVVLPPVGVTALVEFQEETEAKIAFKKLAYSRFRHLPLYLEWAPMNIFKEKDTTHQANLTKTTDEGQETDATEKVDNSEPDTGSTIFVKGISFNTTEDELKKHFKKCGSLHIVSVSKKKNIQTGEMLSMGFGFVQFKKRSSAVEAIQTLQSSVLDGRVLELKFSNKATIEKAEIERKKSVVTEQKTAKILVRNVPFEVSETEIRDLFKDFGCLKSVRLPKKMTGDGGHRGFAFIEFSNKNNAKRAFDALCHSTHLLGRRLVLEWANPNAEDVVELRRKTAKDYFSAGPSQKLKKTKLTGDVMLTEPLD